MIIKVERSAIADTWDFEARLSADTDRVYAAWGRSPAQILSLVRGVMDEMEISQGSWSRIFGYRLGSGDRPSHLQESTARSMLASMECNGGVHLDAEVAACEEIVAVADDWAHRMDPEY